MGKETWAVGLAILLAFFAARIVNNFVSVSTIL